MEGRSLLSEIRGRPIDLVPGRRVISISPGEWTSPFEGKGFEPRGYRDFELGDSPRAIHLPTSARRGTLTIVERVALRDFKIMIVIDLSPSMLVRRKPVIQHEAAALLLYAAWKLETTFALAVRTADGIHSYGAGIGSRHFYRSFQILWRTCTSDAELRLHGSRIHLRRCLPPNAMLIYCSDFLDAGGGTQDLENMLRLVCRYDFVPIIIQDDLEFSFPRVSEPSLITFVNPETRDSEDIWVSPQAAARIAARHEERFAAVTSQLSKRDIKFIHLAEQGVDAAFDTIGGFFRCRRRLAA